MSQSYRITFLVTLALIFLAPLFFVPGAVLQLGAAKSALLSFGSILLVLSYLYESFRQGSFSFPRHYLLYAAILMPVVYLLSAVLSTPSSLSLLGYNLEVGTFGFALLGALALVVSAGVVVETGRYLQALTALFASFTLLALFVLVKILVGPSTLLGANNMGNPLGSWTDLAVAFGMLASLAALALGMIPMRPLVKMVIYGVFALATFLLVVIGFSTAFMLTLVAAIFLWLYLGKVEKDFYLHSQGFFSKATLLPILLGAISLVMFINPNVSETQSLSGAISDQFGIQNSDVRPTLSATLGISKAVLSQAGLLGSGPNTFGQDWLIFKPLTVNATPFWGVAFPFGVGFIPTQIATTGILGTTLWLAFLFLLLVLGLKVLGKVPESRAVRFTLISTLFIALFLWLTALFYVPSAALLFLAFIFTGFLLSLSRDHGVVPSHTVNLREASPHRLVALSLVALCVAGALYFGMLSGEKALGAYHFQKAVRLSNTEGALITDVENELMKAVKLDGVDAYFAAISQLNFSKAQAAANSATGTPETNQAIFEEGLRRSIEAARAAVSANPASYRNWVALGSIYSSLVPEPLQVEGAYENAQYAYGEAQRRNPNNPELPLFLAQLEIAKGNPDNARSYIRNSIALKEDYADAYLLLAQLEIREKNIPGAIASTEALTILAPENAGVHFELGVLKYSNTDYTGAVTSLLKAIQLSPDYANAKYYLGLSYAQLGRVSEARSEFEDLLVSNPDSAEIRQALEALQN